MHKSFEKIENHPIEHLQILMGLIVDVWSKAQSSDNFSVRLFQGDYKELFKSEKAQKKNDYLWKPTKEIFDIVKGQTMLQQKIACAFITNSQIETICSNSNYRVPYQYNDFYEFNLGLKLQRFCENLYNKMFDRATFKNTFGTTLKEYYNDLTKDKHVNCPFCGIDSFADEISGNREAFDHYFAKSLYPFTSVTLDNLFPMCHKCNSQNKSTADVIYNQNIRKSVNRRKVFFPFDESINDINLIFELSFNRDDYDLTDTDSGDFDINVTNENRKEEIETWFKIFKLKSRYRGRISQLSDDWIEDLIEIFQDDRDVKSNREIIDDIIDKTTKRPLHEVRFLKHPFYKALDTNGNLEATLDKL